MFLKIKTVFILGLILFFIPSELISQELTSVKHPEWSYDKVIYEVNLRQYTEDGSFKAFEEHLPRLKEMGVGIIWLMPIHPIGEKNRKGTLGSYYSVKDYFAIDSSYGTIEDFKSLVNKVHESGMHIIIDWVANHTAWDNEWAAEHPEFYTKDSAGNFVPPVDDWSDVIDLNYDNEELRNYMIGVMMYWVKELDIDGFRCDVAAMVPIDFWLNIRKQLDSIKPVFMLAEAWEPELHEAFDMTYSWGMHHLMSEVAKGEKNVNDIKLLFEKENKMYPESAFRMQFTSNHDENTWNGTVREKFEEAAGAFAALTYVIPGMPLIYSGQEAGLDKRLRFFDKDTIVWKKSEFEKLYKKLNELKKDNNTLLNGEKGGKMQILTVSGDSSKILSFVREKNGDKIFSIFNLSKEKTDFKIESQKIKGLYKELNSEKEQEFGNVASFNLKPWEYKIFYKN